MEIPRVEPRSQSAQGQGVFDRARIRVLRRRLLELAKELEGCEGLVVTARTRFLREFRGVCDGIDDAKRFAWESLEAWIGDARESGDDRVSATDLDRLTAAVSRSRHANHSGDQRSLIGVADDLEVAAELSGGQAFDRSVFQKAVDRLGREDVGST